MIAAGQQHNINIIRTNRLPVNFLLLAIFIQLLVSFQSSSAYISQCKPSLGINGLLVLIYSEMEEIHPKS